MRPAELTGRLQRLVVHLRYQKIKRERPPFNTDRRRIAEDPRPGPPPPSVCVCGCVCVCVHGCCKDIWGCILVDNKRRMMLFGSTINNWTDVNNIAFFGLIPIIGNIGKYLELKIFVLEFITIHSWAVFWDLRAFRTFGCHRMKHVSSSFCC